MAHDARCLVMSVDVDLGQPRFPHWYDVKRDCETCHVLKGDVLDAPLFSTITFTAKFFPSDFAGSKVTRSVTQHVFRNSS